MGAGVDVLGAGWGSPSAHSPPLAWGARKSQPVFNTQADGSLAPLGERFKDEGPAHAWLLHATSSSRFGPAPSPGQPVRHLLPWPAHRRWWAAQCRRRIHPWRADAPSAILAHDFVINRKSSYMAPSSAARRIASANQISITWVWILAVKISSVFQVHFPGYMEWPARKLFWFLMY